MFLFFSCKKDPSPLFTNSVITGYSDTYDSGNTNSNIKVIASGPYGSATTQTVDGGHYMISGLGNGTYRLDFVKEGYGTIKMYNIQLFGNDTVNISHVSLFKKYDKFVMPAVLKVSNEKYRFSNSTVVIETNLISDTGVLPNPLPVVLYTDSVKNVSYKSYTSKDPIVDAAFQFLETQKILFIFDTRYLPFKSGKEVFFILYVANRDEVYNGYFDKYMGIEQFSTLIPEKHSQVMSFIMP